MSFRLTEEEYQSILNRNKKRKENKIAFGNRKISEKEIQNNIRDYLQLNGWYVIRHQQSMGSLKGLSDLSAIKDGKTIYIEVKTERGIQSEYQKEFQYNIELHGGTYILARSINDIKKYL